MSFPLSYDPNNAYDNVAKLQAFLLFSNPDNNMPIDGIFGKLTRDAVIYEVEDFTTYGYENIDYRSKPIITETVTKAYYDEQVLPNLRFFLDNQ